MGDPLLARAGPDRVRMSSDCRVCDYCSESTALLYCRADSAKLCLACDRQVHSTNPLFTKHTRTQLCDACDDAPVMILCSNDDLILCQNCDWEMHSSNKYVHDRKLLEAFCGCPTVCELMVVFGLEDLGKKVLKRSLEESDKEGFDQSDEYEFSDLLVWDAPTVFNLDDLIGGADSSSGFVAAEAPFMPKVIKGTCGKHKEEVLRQLREMAKNEMGFSYEDADQIVRFNVDEPVLQPSDVLVDCENDEKPVIKDSYKENALSCSRDSNKPGSPALNFTVSEPINEDALVPEKPCQCDTARHPSQPINNHEESVTVPLKMEILPYVPKVHSHEFNTQERDTALWRYKEKKKNRRYDKLIRYESRKVRAESRIRIKGRFAKSTDQ